MLRVLVFLLATGYLADAQETQARRTLEDIARIATVMIDGDLCTNIETTRSAGYVLKKDPRDPWIAADNYDVNAGPFIETKKTLIRLARLCPSACDVNLWMRVPSRPDRVQIVIRNVHELSQFWKWGDMDQAIPPEMARVLDGGKYITVRQNRGMTSVLAPVYNSLEDIVALVEVVSQDNPDLRENVK